MSPNKEFNNGCLVSCQDGCQISCQGVCEWNCQATNESEPEFLDLNSNLKDNTKRDDEFRIKIKKLSNELNRRTDKMEASEIKEEIKKLTESLRKLEEEFKEPDLNPKRKITLEE